MMTLPKQGNSIYFGPEGPAVRGLGSVRLRLRLWTAGKAGKNGISLTASAVENARFSIRLNAPPASASRSQNPKPRTAGPRAQSKCCCPARHALDFTVLN